MSEVSASTRACLVVGLLGSAIACSEGPSPAKDPVDGDGGSGQDGGSGGGGGKDSPGSGGVSDDGTGGHAGSYPDVVFSYDPSRDEPRETCASEIFVAEELPLDLYVVLDKSGSMRPSGDDCDVAFEGEVVGDNRWCRAVSALGRYFTGSYGEGHRAAIQFMSVPREMLVENCGPGDLNPHSTPEVPFTTLPDERDGPLVLALNDAIAYGATEIESALNGIADYTSQNITPGRRTVGLLITDGTPSGVCDTDTSELAAIASNHLRDTGIPTYMIGITGASFDTLEDMASLSGAPAHTEFCDATHQSCHYWSVEEGDPEAFVAALQHIQEVAVGCAFALPRSDDGLLDLDRVLVRVAPEDGATPVELERVQSEEECTGEQFFPVGAEMNPGIKLCAQACALVGDEGQVEVEVGCEGE